MSFKDMSKEDLELYSHKDLTNIILEEMGPMNTADLFKKITTALGLSNSFYENKIGDYYTTLTTDKRFVMLDDGNWDLSKKYSSKMKKVIEDEDEEDEDEEDEEEKDEMVDSENEDEDDYDSQRNDDDFDDENDDLKDLVVIDEDELELEE